MALSIALLYGGISSEREVSLESGKCVYEALKKNFDQVQLIDVNENFEKEISKINADVFYIILHGVFGEDGQVQKILEKNGKKFTGSGSKSCALTMDKILTKELLAKNQILTSPFLKITPNISPEEINETLGLPLVVKPILGGSSVELYIVKSMEELKKVPLKPHLFAEKFIKGREFTIGIIDGKALPVIEIATTKGVYDYEAKYISSSTNYLFDSLSPELEKKMQSIAEKVYHLTESEDVARVDFILSSSNEPYVLEINSIPGMTTHSLLPKAAAKMGINFEDLCKRIVNSAINRIVVN
jgi:D-alanine-D-alanine ligase